jgi:uncharacterized protein (TIGR00369 family)
MAAAKSTNSRATPRVRPRRAERSTEWNAEVGEDFFEQRAADIRVRVAQQGFMKFIGAELEELAPGICVISIARRPELLQQHGFFHGGVTAFLVDNGTTIAASTWIRPGRAVLTAEYKLNFVSPAVGDRLVCRARVVKPGNMLSVVTADVFSVSGADEKLTATALATIASIDAAQVAPKRGG